MPYMRPITLCVVALALGQGSAPATPPGSKEFNSFVLGAVTKLERERGGGGYSINKSFSRDLDYDVPGAISRTPRARAPDDHQTMCVAAVAEVMIEAINAYVADHRRSNNADRVASNSTETPYRLLPASTWTQSNPMSIRPYLYIQGRKQNILGRAPGDTPRSRTKDGVQVIAYARGTGHALETFKIGEEITFDRLRPGDFVNFNREVNVNGVKLYSGHAVVFIKYISPDNTYTYDYVPDVIGFEYFSAQGMKPGTSDAGLARRDAYFGDYKGHSISHPMDRHLIRPTGDLSSRRALLLLNGGRMWNPERWQTGLALQQIRELVRRSTQSTSPQQRAAAVTRALTDETAESAVELTGEEG